MHTVGLMASDAEIWRFNIARGFRATIVGHTVALFGQAVLAGLALSGDADALPAHMTLGALTLLISASQVSPALMSRTQIPRWALLASIALLGGDGIQMASGRLHLFVVHLPLGLPLVAVSCRRCGGSPPRKQSR